MRWWRVFRISANLRRPDDDMKLMATEAECAFCGLVAPTKYMSWDHIIPRSRGGANIADNRQVLCFWCNAKKKDRLLPFQLPMALRPTCGTCGRGHRSIEHSGSLTHQAHVEGVL